MLEECLMSWTARDSGKVENWFVVSLNLKHWSRQYVVERSTCAAPPPWPQQLRAGPSRHTSVPGARREMLEQPWAWWAAGESPVRLLQSVKLHHLPWWPLRSSESGDTNSSSRKNFSCPAAHEHQCRKGSASCSPCPQGSGGTWWEPLGWSRLWETALRYWKSRLMTVSFTRLVCTSY